MRKNENVVIAATAGPNLQNAAVHQQRSIPYGQATVPHAYMHPHIRTHACGHPRVPMAALNSVLIYLRRAVVPLTRSH